MGRLPLVLLLSADPLAQLVVTSGLLTYGYDVALAVTEAEALHHLQSRRVCVFVADVDSDLSNSFALVRAARKADPALAVIYTARMPSKLPDREKVAGAPCLRTPYHPHQLVSLIGQLTRRGMGDNDESHAA
jgi:DNA-binding response OmpR family regulator